MLNRPAWDRNFFNWPNRVWAQFVMRILSMRRTSSFSYWVHAGCRLFHTEYAQDVVFFILNIDWTWSQSSSWTILSIRRTSSFSYWVCAGHCLFHTEYAQDIVFFILSMRRRSSYSYWVCAEKPSELYWVWIGSKFSFWPYKTTSHTSEENFYQKIFKGGRKGTKRNIFQQKNWP